MLKFKRRALSVLIASTMLASMITGCSGGQNAATTAASSASTSAAATTVATTAPEKEEPIEFSFVSWNCGAITEDNWAEKQLEEKLNVKIETMKVDLSQTQQLDLMLASGEMPDCAWLFKSPTLLEEQGIIRSIPKSFIEEYAPNYTALLNSEPIGWELNKSKKTGEYLALSGYHAGNADSAMFMSCYRLDWLEKLGIKPNGELVQVDDEGRIFLATEPFQKSQFLEIMEKFTKNDPDGNGIDDTFGMAASQEGAFHWEGLRGMFGISTMGEYVENGVANYYYATEKYKEFLRFAADLYANGYLDKEFATIDFNKANEKVATSKAGFIGGAYSWIGKTATFAQTRAPMVIINQIPEGKALIVPTEVDDNGNGGCRPYTLSNFTNSFFVNNEVDDEKLAAILKFFDYAHFDEEAKIYLRFGEEGTHFNYLDPVNKKGPALVDGLKNGGDVGLFVYNSNYIADEKIKAISWAKDQTLVMGYAWNEFADKIVYPDKYDLLNETKLQELAVKYDASINTLVSEFFYNVVGGEIDIDAGWDQYIKNIESAGYDKVREELQKAPDYSKFHN